MADRVDRRRFLQSLFGMTAVGETSTSDAEAKGATQRGAINFFWANVRNGQVAFPTGMTVPNGQPGSLMKLVTAAALLESGLYVGDRKVECRGVIEFQKHSYKCLYPHGHVDLVKAIGMSCNVFFATLAQELSPNAIVDYARRFGLDEPVAGFGGDHLPAHPSAEPAQYALGLAPDFQVNALQIVRVVTLIALNGKSPPLHNAAEDAAAQTAFTTDLQASTWQTLQQGMRLAAREGTAHKLDAQDTLKIAAKTGTVPHGNSFYSWVAGYFPYDQPRYAFCLRAASGTSQDRAIPEAHRFLVGCPWP